MSQMQIDNKTVCLRAVTDVSVRAAQDGKNYVDFYAAVFNHQSKLIREYGEVFYEIIDPKAFDNVLADPGLNTIATIDHKREKILGRVKSGTLTMGPDKRGVKCSLEMPNTTRGNDMLEMIRRKDYEECSFIYTIAEGGVRYDRSGDIPVRTVTDIADLIDVSFVIDGAFDTTDIYERYARALRQYQDNEPEEQKPPQTESRNILVKLERKRFNLKHRIS